MITRKHAFIVFKSFYSEVLLLFLLLLHATLIVFFALNFTNNLQPIMSLTYTKKEMYSICTEKRTMAYSYFSTVNCIVYKDAEMPA